MKGVSFGRLITLPNRSYCCALCDCERRCCWLEPDRLMLCASESDEGVYDDAGINRLDGAGAGRWQLPTDVWAGFERLFPDTKLLAWNRVVTDYDRVAYHVIFEEMSGVEKDAWLTPEGELTVAPPPPLRR